MEGNAQGLSSLRLAVLTMRVLKCARSLSAVVVLPWFGFSVRSSLFTRGFERFRKDRRDVTGELL